MPISRRFGTVFSELTKGASNREVARRAGISNTYVAFLRDGTVPSFRVLQQVASGLELSEEDRERLFLAAGYSPHAEDAETGEDAETERLRQMVRVVAEETIRCGLGAQRLLLGLAELQREYPGIEAIVQPEWAVTTVDEADRILTNLRELAQREVF